MAAVVKFRGVVLLDGTEGLLSEYVPGMISPVWQMVKLPRALGESAKHLGAQGADHQVKVVFLRVAKAGVAGIFTRLRDLLSPASGSPLSGTLEVADFPAVANCVFVSCVPSAAKLGGMVSGADGSFEGVYDLEFSLVFRQLRR